MQKTSLSTAKAPPAGTRLISAASIITESNIRISSFKDRTHFQFCQPSKSLNTQVPQNFHLNVPVNTLPVSFRKGQRQFPCFTSCHTASQPASPAPITFTFTSFRPLTFSHIYNLHYSRKSYRFCLVFKEQAAALRTSLVLNRHIPYHKVTLRRMFTTVVNLTSP